MNNLIQYLEMVMDLRQEKKVKHKMMDIIAIVFFASVANANEWIEIYYFAVAIEKFLYLNSNYYKMVEVPRIELGSLSLVI